MTAERLETVDGTNWEAFLASRWSVLMLGKSDCERCRQFTEELQAFLADASAYPDVRFGKMLLDRGGLAGFKRANPWLAETDVLPYTLIYRGGDKVAEFAGGGIARLQSRLQRVRSAA